MKREEIGILVTSLLIIPAAVDAGFLHLGLGRAAANKTAQVVEKQKTVHPLNFTLAVSVSGNGTVSSSPAGIRDCGSSGGVCRADFRNGTQVVLTKATGGTAIFAGWSGGGCSGTPNSCVLTANADKAVAAVFLGPFSLTVSVSGAGAVSSSSPGISNCSSTGGTCTAELQLGAQIALTATANGGSTFSGWSGGGCLGTGTCTVTMAAARSVTAMFAPIIQLRVGSNGAGSGTIASSPSGIDCGAICSYGFAAKTSVTLTATPASGSAFTGWIGGGCSGIGNCTITLTGSESVTALFLNGTMLPLASGQHYPAGIAVDAARAYWANGATVMSVPVGGGTPVALASGQGGAFGIAVDAVNVYWTDFSNGTVMKVSKDGGTPVTLASGQNGPVDIVVDPTRVYWTSLYNGTVETIPIAGGTPVTLASGQNYPNGIALDATNVYWLNNGNGTLMKVPKNGGASVRLAYTGEVPADIAVDATNVYWITAGWPGTVMKVPIGGGSAVTLASGQNSPTNIAVDAASIYWTNWGLNSQDGSVMRVPIGGGMPTVLATGQNYASGIAVDASSVYWTSYGNGTVLKLTPK
ncbi:MAG: hypothetical protein NTX64_18980 [Elusimicrobia bacterium]|nr:hypothetical protein [Elusimicrobiota bacterium]